MMICDYICKAIGITPKNQLGQGCWRVRQAGWQPSESVLEVTVSLAPGV